MRLLVSLWVCRRGPGGASCGGDKAPRPGKPCGRRRSGWSRAPEGTLGARAGYDAHPDQGSEETGSMQASGRPRRTGPALGTALPLAHSFSSSIPSHTYPLPSSLIYFFLLSHLLPVPPPDLHPPTYTNEASRFLTKRNHCQMKYITIKYLILSIFLK